MPPDLIYHHGSPPCRAVLLAASALGVDLNKKPINFVKLEALAPEYKRVKIVPHHRIPSFVDDGLKLWESRSIMTYLSDQYGKDDSLYPKDPKRRALVDQKLYFDIDMLYGSCADYYYPILFSRSEPDPAKFEKVKEAFSTLETFLENEDYVAGNHLTLADLSILANVTTFEAANFDLKPYKKIDLWVDRVITAIPEYGEVNYEGLLCIRQYAIDSIEER